MNVKIVQQQQQQFLQQLQSSSSSSQQIQPSEASQLKLQVKMGAKEYADIRERMGKILSDIEDNGEDDQYDESCRRQKDIKNGYSDNSNFGQVSSFLPSLSTPSIISGTGINRPQQGQSCGTSSVPGSLSIFSRQASPKAAGDSRTITKDASDLKNKTASFWSSKTDSQGNLKIAAIIKRRNQSVNVLPERQEQEKSTEIPKEIKTLLVHAQSQQQSASISQPSSPGNNNTNNYNILGNTTNVGSLLSSVTDIGYMKHLRSMESKGSFHDELNKLEYRSHIQEQFGNSLFSNRNVLMNLKGQSIGAIPKKFDHIHITEAIIPTLFNSRNMSSSNSFRSKPQQLQNTQKIQQNAPLTHHYAQPLSTKSNSSKDFNIKQQVSTRTSRTPSNATTPTNNNNNMKNQQQQQLQQPLTAQFSYQKNDLILCTTPSKRTNNSQQQQQSQGDQLSQPLQRTSSNFGLPSQDKESEPRLTTAQMINTILGAGSSINNTINPFDSNNPSHSQDILSHPSVSHKPMEFPRKFVQPDVKNKVTKRQETANVRRWMDEKLQDLLKISDLSVNQIFTYFQNIFQASISEVLRQIGEECKEREVLIQDIWDSQVSLSEKIFIAISNQNQQSENISLKEINRLHKHYQFELQKQFTLVDEKTSLTKDLQEHLTREIQENRFVRKKAQKLEKNYKVINNQMTQLQEEYNIIFQENLAWLMNAKSINWDTALEQKKKMLEEIHLNRKMRNNLLKIGDEVRKDKMTIEELAQKQEIDNLVNQFVIDRESNLPVELIKPEEEPEIDEPFELDENKQPILRDFQRDESTSTEGLIEYIDGETSMLKIQTFEAYTQTRKKKTNELAIQKDIDVADTEEVIVQTEQYAQNEFTQTHEIETMDMMVQCCLIGGNDIGIAVGQKIDNMTDQQLTRQPTVVPTIPLVSFQEQEEEESEDEKIDVNEQRINNQKTNTSIKQIAASSKKIQSDSNNNSNSNNRLVSRGQIQSNRRVQEPSNAKQSPQSKQMINNQGSTNKIDNKQIIEQANNGSPGLKSKLKINNSSSSSNKQIGKTNSPLKTRLAPGNHVKLSISSSSPLVKSQKNVGDIPITQKSSQTILSKQAKNGSNNKNNKNNQQGMEEKGEQMQNLGEGQEIGQNKISSDDNDDDNDIDDSNQDDGYNNNNGDVIDAGENDEDDDDESQNDNESYFLTGLDGQQTKQMNRMTFNRKKQTHEPSINFKLQSQDSKSNTYLRSGRQLSPSSGYSIPSDKLQQQQQQQQQTAQDILQGMEIRKSMELSEKVLKEIENELPNSPVEIISNHDNNNNKNQNDNNKIQFDQDKNTTVNMKIPDIGDGSENNHNNNNNRVQSDMQMLLQLFSDGQMPRKEVEQQVRGYVEEISIERQTLNTTISILQKQLEVMKSQQNQQQRGGQTADYHLDKESFQFQSKKNQRLQQQSFAHYNNNRDEVSEIVSPSSVKTPFSDTTNQMAKSIFRPANTNNNNNNNTTNNHHQSQQQYLSRNPQPESNSPKSIFGIANAGSSPKSNQSRYLNTISSQKDSFSHRSSLSVSAQNNNNFSSASKKVSIFGNGKPTNYNNPLNRADSSSGSSYADENSITQKDEDIMNMSRSRIQGNSNIAAKRNWNLEKLAISQIKQEQIAMNSSYINNNIGSPRVLKQSPGVASIARGSFSAQFVPDSPRSSISATAQKNKTYSANTDSALAMRRKLKSIRGYIKAPKNSLKYLPQIYKMMNSVFNDNLKTIKSNEAILNPLYVQVYEYFLYLFGLRKVAEIKMAQVLEQCLLMAEDYLSINIFMSMYISDMKSTELDFVCKTMYLLSELSQGVRVEKTNTNKAKVLQAIPQLFEQQEMQKNLCKILNNWIGKGNNNNSTDAGQLSQSQQEIDERRNSLFIVLCQAPGWTAEQLSEFTNLKLDLFEVMRVLLKQYKEQKKHIGMEYFGTFYTVMTSVEHSLIDEEGIRFLANLCGFTDQNTHQLVMNFRSKSIMSEMSYDQFLLFANRLDIFKTSQLASSLGVQQNHIGDEQGIQQLSDLKEFWVGNKQTIISQIISNGNYTNYVKNVIEKMDILVALLDSDELDSNNQSYLLKHKLPFMICQAILKKVAGWENQ